MSLPWQQWSAPQYFAWFHWIGHPQKLPSRPKHLRSICHTSRLMGDFVQVQILGSKFWALGGLNQKSIEENSFVECHMENWRPKNGSIPSRNKKRRNNLKFVRDRQTDRRRGGDTDRQSQRQKIINKTPRLGAESTNGHYRGLLYCWKQYHPRCADRNKGSTYTW